MLNILDMQKHIRQYWTEIRKCTNVIQRRDVLKSGIVCWYELVLNSFVGLYNNNSRMRLDIVIF